MKRVARIGRTRGIAGAEHSSLRTREKWCIYTGSRVHLDMVRAIDTKSQRLGMGICGRHLEGDHQQRQHNIRATKITGP